MSSTLRRLLMALGGIALVVQIAGAIVSHRQERRLATYVEVEATIRYTAVDRHTSTQRRNRRVTTTTTHHPIVEYEYVVDGRSFRSSQLTLEGSRPSGSTSEVAAMIARFPVGSRLKAWHDPDDPAKAFLLRQTTFVGYALVILPLPLTVLGVIAFARRKPLSLPHDPIRNVHAALHAALAMLSVGALCFAHYALLAEGRFGRSAVACLVVLAGYVVLSAAPAAVRWTRGR